MTDAPDPHETVTTPIAEDALAAHGTNPWAIRDFRLLWGGRLMAVLAIQIQSTAVVWQVLEIARRDHPIEQASLYAGMVGLAQFVPFLFLTLPAGEMADRRDRRMTVAACIGSEMVCAALFLGMAIHGNPPLWGLLAVAALFGATRAFLAPASQALLPMIVGRAALPRAIVAQSLAFQTGALAGPTLGGLALAFSMPFAYGASFLLFMIGVTSMLLIRTNGKPQQVGARQSPLEAVKEGLGYVWSNKIVFGAISLDLVVVLFAGVALLVPVFAASVLDVGPQGFGLLRTAFGAGAFLMGLYLSRFPIVRRGGLWMFAAVAAFGLCTLTFGVSKIVWISAAALFIGGAADMVSVNIRQTLIQLATPDHMRGRVSSVSMLFIGASNELGEAYSGVMVRILSPVGAAVFGGIGALAATGVWARLFPGLRKADRLN
ncbi:MFS transporter [soil metagenome]